MGILKKDELKMVDGSQERLLPLLMAYQQAVDTSIISSITDVKGTIIHVNQLFCEVSKFSRQELLGQNHRIINSGFHPKEFIKEMWKTIGKGEVWHGEIKNQAKDGSYYWVDSVIVPIKDRSGKPVQYLSLRTLISERKKKKKEIEKNRSMRWKKCCLKFLMNLDNQWSKSWAYPNCLTIPETLRKT